MTAQGGRGFEAWITFIIALLAMLAPFSIDAYMPSFPDIAAELVASPLQMQQTMSFYMAGFAVMNLFYGSISDAYGRRGVVLTALLGYALISVGCALTADIHTLLLLRLGQGLFASAGVVVGRAMVRDLFEGHAAQRVMSHSMLWFAIAPALAPVVGGWLHSVWGWRAVFWFLALFALVLAALVALRMKESLPLSQRQSLHPVYLLRMYGQALRHGRFLAITFGTAIFFAGFFLYITSAPTMVYEHLGLGPTDFIYLFGPLVAGMMAGSFLSGRLAGRWSQRRLLNTGMVLMVGAAVANLLQSLWLEPGLVNTLLPVAVYVMGMALIMPVLNLLGIDCYPNNRGLAASMMGFIQMGTNALVAGVAVPLLYHSVTLLALGMAGFFALAWAIFHHGVGQTVSA